MEEDSIKHCPYDEMEFVWIENHYDIHLYGLCREEGKLHRFKADYDTAECIIYRLSLAEKINWVIKKSLFEWCIGFHWSYPNRKNGVRFHYRRPRWLFGLIYKFYYWCRL